MIMYPFSHHPIYVNNYYHSSGSGKYHPISFSSLSIGGSSLSHNNGEDIFENFLYSISGTKED